MEAEEEETEGERNKGGGGREKEERGEERARGVGGGPSGFGKNSASLCKEIMHPKNLIFKSLGFSL